ncbi:MAG TPA: dockerin type I domain-containing protein, partial [Fimbriimonadaceae bacterium]|nr:dockerin type I domain-containing protein [Fimbriimonadaceae bacterium]
YGSGKADRCDEEGWTLMPDQTILTCDALNAPQTEKLVLSTAQWISAGSTPQSLEDASSEELGPMVLRPNGTVFAMGATGHNAVYTPGSTPGATGSWTAAPDFPSVPFNGQPMPLDIADGPACLLPSGNVICQTSPGVYNTPSHFFEFDGSSLTEVSDVPNSLDDPSYVGDMLMLPTGQVLYTDQSQDVEVYTPTGSPQAAWRPAVSECPAVLAPGMSFILQGTQLNGLSQCSAYGDDSTNATNYPLVQITNTATGHVQYARTHDHSTMAVATGSATVSTHVDLPTNLETGAATLRVVTNGIASNPVSVTIATKIVKGTVTLQNYSVSPNGVAVKLQIRHVGSTTALDSQSVVLDSSGSFQMATTLAAGTYDIAVKGAHWLREKLGSKAIGSSGLSGLQFSLVNGDINGDNTVSLADFAILKQAYGSTAGQSNWNPNADLDGNGSVGLSDFGILKVRYGQSGNP